MMVKITGFTSTLFVALIGITAISFAQKAGLDVEVFEIELYGNGCRIVLTDQDERDGAQRLEYPDDCAEEFEGLVSYKMADQGNTVIMFAEGSSQRRKIDAAVVFEKESASQYAGIFGDGDPVILTYLGYFDPFIIPSARTDARIRPDCLHFADDLSCAPDSEYTAELIASDTYVPQLVRVPLNVRQGAGVGFQVIGALQPNQCAPVITCKETAAEQQTWCQTNLDGQIAWFAKRIDNAVFAANGC
ncbi:MAG: hypothetical protein AAGI92_11020 [Pseudomonadota bacterium]